MTDLSEAVVPKSDQINADNLLAGSITIRVSKVEVKRGTQEQPVSIFFEGDNGKPYKPCKSMTRVLIAIWGADSSGFVGKSMTLFCDPKVTWGGLAVGGIRISHMSGISKPVTLMLTATKANRKPFVVHPLIEKSQPKTDALDDVINNQPNPETLELARTAAGGGTDVFTTWWKSATQIERAAANTIKGELAILRTDADKEQAARLDEIAEDEMP